uniref:Uncharacterized protein n=1 Tax=Plectus sambesii TaxID=2011161 RepID=A0A914WV30_9BILA
MRTLSQKLARSSRANARRRAGRRAARISAIEKSATGSGIDQTCQKLAWATDTPDVCGPTERGGEREARAFGLAAACAITAQGSAQAREQFSNGDINQRIPSSGNILPAKSAAPASAAFAFMGRLSTVSPPSTTI